MFAPLSIVKLGWVLRFSHDPRGSLQPSAPRRYVGEQRLDELPVADGAGPVFVKRAHRLGSHGVRDVDAHGVERILEGGREAAAAAAAAGI